MDARKLKHIIEPNYESAPPIEDIIHKSRNKKCITKFDLSSILRQIPLTENSKQYTRF